MDSIKKQIKKTILYKLVIVFRVLRDLPYYLQLIHEIKDKQADRVVFLLGTVLHKNMGDHLITYAEMCFLKEYLPSDTEIVQVPIEIYELFGKYYKKNISSRSVIYINGGGWMGDVWPEHEILMQKIIKDFSDHRIIVFPQTIFYNDADCQLFYESQKIYCATKKLTICVRDENSYDFAKNQYKNIEVMLVPDMALSLRHKDVEQLSGIQEFGREYLGVCLRSDREMVDVNQKELIQMILDKDVEIKISDVSTMSKTRIREKNRKKALSALFVKYARCKLVVTDRLHSMIICYLTNTPCLVFDNATHKINGCYSKWLSDSRNILYANSKGKNEILEFVDKALKRQFDGQDNKELDFSLLIKAVNYGKNI